MGILSAIIHTFINIRKASRLRAMSKSDWLDLEDEKFYDALSCVCEDAVYDINDAEIPEVQKNIYSLIMFEMEVNNGGLCQFFVNSSRECAPYVSNALEMVGAARIKTLFDGFILENNIDVRNLESFKVQDVDEYIEQTKRFDFDSFDDQFYEDEEFHNKIIAYCRENLEKII